MFQSSKKLRQNQKQIPLDFSSLNCLQIVSKFYWENHAFLKELKVKNHSLPYIIRITYIICTQNHQHPIACLQVCAVIEICCSSVFFMICQYVIYSCCSILTSVSQNNVNSQKISMDEPGSLTQQQRTNEFKASHNCLCMQKYV